MVGGSKPHDGESSHEQLLQWIAHIGPDAEEVYMTTAEMLRAEGEAKGRAETLLRQLDMKFGPLSQAVVNTARDGTGKQLEAWTERVLTAETLDDVLR